MISTAIDQTFSTLYSVLIKTNFMKAAASKLGKTPSPTSVQKLLAAGAPHLPIVFRDGYAIPLEKELAPVFARLGASRELDVDTLETLTGCVYELANDGLRPTLHRFLAVISNLYRSFLDSSKRANLNIPLQETLPPLATWQSDPSNGPFTITCEQVAGLFGASMGVVSMPATFADHPLLYGSLAHETGGHDVIHADTTLMPELRIAVHELFTGEQAWLGHLWDYWMDEAAADIYGVLNIGPSFGYNLALLLAVFIAEGTAALTHRPVADKPSLRTESGADEYGRLDPHPTDILRLALVQGAVNVLTGLSPSSRSAYFDRLTTLSQSLAPEASSVALNGLARTTDGKTLTLQDSVPLELMQEAARRVGAMIATLQLDALAGHTVQDIETWDDHDENAALTIAGRLGAGASIVGAGDDAQILAGLTLAAMRDPGAYASLSALASAALDDSFATDPYWSVGPRDLMVVKPTLSRAAPEVQVDPFAARIIDYNPLDDDSDNPLRLSVAETTTAKIAPIPWPAGKAPQPDTGFHFAGSDAELPKADMVLVTWTSAEANAMAAVLTPGAWAMPRSHYQGPSWHTYTNQWDAKFAGRSSGRSPAATNHYIGKYMPILIGGRKVLLFKSNFHLARDDKSMPVLDMFKQVIQQTSCELIVSTGTAGAIGGKLQLGDVVVANQARFKLDGTFKSAPFNGQSYSSSYALPDTGSLKLVNSKLVQANAAPLKSAAIPPTRPAPVVYTTGQQASVGEPIEIVTTDSFEYDAVSNPFHLQGLGAMVEMDDAVLGLACQQLGRAPPWLAIRNASDPQMPAGATKTTSSDIYLKYGYWTSIPSVLAAWAAVLDF